jgi:hypothetical protein
VHQAFHEVLGHGLPGVLAGDAPDLQRAAAYREREKEGFVIFDEGCFLMCFIDLFCRG